jgi:NAD+ synthase
MTEQLTIALAQINPTVGDIAGNLAKLGALRDEAAAKGADLIVASEMVVSGYPPDDLVLKPTFQQAVMDSIAEFAKTTKGGPALIVGAPWRDGMGRDGVGRDGVGRDGGAANSAGELRNAALFLCDGAIQAVRYKWDLPNYGVFDEKRVFQPGPLPDVIGFRGLRLGVMICEDMWTPTVSAHLRGRGADILIVPNASPFEIGKVERRLGYAAARVAETELPLIYVNQACGQDDLVFDGAAFAFDGDGALACRLPSFTESLSLLRFRHQGKWRFDKGDMAAAPARLETIYRAMMLDLRDYVTKNRFPGVLIGLSGGIDSAISAAVAADALGPENVRCVMMPSPYTSQESLDDAEACARLLGVRLDNIPIGAAMDAFDSMLAPQFAGTNRDITEENIQARIRGITLMALSNKFGHMVRSTGNKSEMSVGYATLYGDMCGGYSVLKDVYKTTVFELSRWRNAHKPEDAKGPSGAVMPERVITKPPTAELRPNQTDQDSLPPYETLDAILRLMNEEDLGIADIVGRGFDLATVVKVWRRLNIAEYKRRQAPPGVKITRRAFGRERRYPITNAFNEAALADKPVAAPTVSAVRPKL